MPHKVEETLTWARYLYWADLARIQWDDLAEHGRTLGDPNKWTFFARMSQFCAAEYVVIEGWRNAGLNDGVIDVALQRWPKRVELLRRYRNGVFHYQPKLCEERLVGFLREADQSIGWVTYLHSEFCRHYWSFIEDFPGTPQQKIEWRECVLNIVGWIPDDLIEARALRLRQLADQSDIATEGDDGRVAAELRENADRVRSLAHRQVALYRQMSQEFLDNPGK